MKDLTICIPVYKRLDFLKALVESIPEEYPVCVSDNGNFVDDNFFCRKNVRIRHLDSIVPMFSNWNNAIEMVETKWFMLPGDDDVIYPDKLDSIMRQIDRSSDCGFLAFGYDLLNEKNDKREGWVAKRTRRFEKTDAFYHIQRSIPYRSPAIVISTEKSRNIGNYCEEFAYTASDSLFLQHLALAYPMVEVNDIVAGYRMWENNFTSMKVATSEWFEQIDLWINKLAELLQKYNINNVEIGKLHNLIICDNLMFALRNLHSYSSKYRLLTAIGWPEQVGWKNHLKMVRRFLI